MTSTLAAKSDRQIFFSKDEVLASIKKHITDLQDKDNFVIEDETVQSILSKKAQSIDCRVNWTSARMCPNDIIKFFRKKYKIRYVPPIGCTSGDYYVFTKRRFAFF